MMKHQTEAIAQARHSRRVLPADAEVGLRIRSRRLEQRLSQTELANSLGLTFQQIQKYEKGVNRVSAGRLAKIAEVLGVPMTFFFGGSDAMGTSRDARSEGASSVFNLLQSRGSVRMLQAFDKIKSRKAREMLVGMAEEFAEHAV